MAEGLRFVCDACAHAIDAWSDGNPYYIDEDGDKQYAYHPDHERLARGIGNDSPHICLECGEEFAMDSRAPLATCPKCDNANISATFRLDGKRCPYCKAGVFAEDPDSWCVS